MADSQDTRTAPALRPSPAFEETMRDVDLFARLVTLPRASIEIIVESLIAHLDEIDGDPDDEDGDEDQGELDHLPDDDALPRLRFRFAPPMHITRRMQ